MIRALVLFFLFGTLVLFFCSCQKEIEKDDLKYPIVLKRKNYSKGKIRMWVKGAEVLDQQKIADYVGTAFNNVFDINFYQVEFRTPDSANVRYPAALNGVWTVKVIDTGHMEFKGDVHLFPGAVFGNQATLDRSFLIYKSNFYTKGLKTVPQQNQLPPVKYQADLSFVAKGNGKALSIPGYLYKMRLYKRAASFGGHMYGEFTESFLNELEDRDTLVIQTTENNWSL